MFSARYYSIALLLAILLLPVTIHAQVSFYTPTTTFVGGGNLFVADFNGDGKPDLLDSGGDMNLGKGDGTLPRVRALVLTWPL
jgi:hypothetical protein